MPRRRPSRLERHRARLFELLTEAEARDPHHTHLARALEALMPRATDGFLTREEIFNPRGRGRRPELGCEGVLGPRLIRMALAVVRGVAKDVASAARLEVEEHGPGGYISDDRAIDQLSRAYAAHPGFELMVLHVLRTVAEQDDLIHRSLLAAEQTESDEPDCK